ncbi:MAG: DNA gyrase subunit A [Candidatus Izemoplasmatales bacterium]|jgi:DNA gyrase subunit A|nr:DNA gyrase subunit A [Candidatus Izemoplasmatales bacterium]
MEENKPIIDGSTFDKISEINLTSEMKTSFLSYAMSVIVARAIPDVRDGLKPVHRRILYGMDELGVYADKAYKKSARIVGDVMGKYHPHGDSSIYDALVRLAQDFSTRYPLVNGHGNFGSIDGDPPAAMRYTEARMEKITHEILRDLKKDTVDFVDNYDGSEQEPKVLPTRIPNLLVNGSSGIAVAMATNIPPHNLNEILDGYIAYIKNKAIELDEIMEYIKGPDFPTGGIILGTSGILSAYATGKGSIRIKAKTDIVELANGKKQIIVREIPYAVNKTTLIDRIAELAKEGKVEGITDLRDESSRKGMKIVIELRRDANAEVVLNNLLKNSQLQTTFGANMLALVNDKPVVLGLIDMIMYYYEHQVEVLIRKTKFDLEKAQQRLHLLEGFIIALDNIDAVIKIIRESYDDTEKLLMDAFNLSEIQTKAILQMQLRRLSGLEREKIDQEVAVLSDMIKDLQETLIDKTKQDQILIDEALEVKQKYGDARRSEIDPFGDSDIEDEDLIPIEDVIIAVTTNGYVKRMNLDVYRSQNRGGRGKTGINLNEDDVIDSITFTQTHDYLLFFTNLGRVYKMKGYKVPNFGRSSKGLPIVNLLNLNEGEELAAVMSLKNFDEGFLFFTTKNGLVKRTSVSNFQNIRVNGIRAITLKDDDFLHSVRLTDGNRDIIIGASNGKAIRFNENDVREMGRTAAGVKGISLSEKESVVGVSTVTEDRNQILAITKKGYGKRTDVDEYRLQKRGGKGVKTINVTSKNGDLAKLISVVGNEDLLAVSDKGIIIRTPIDQISITKRATQGVKIINLVEEHVVSTIALVDKDEEVDDINIETNEEMIEVASEVKPLETPKTEDLTETEENIEDENIDIVDENEDDEEVDELEEILKNSY